MGKHKLLEALPESFLQDAIVSPRDQLYVPRESSCPIPRTHINVTRHVRDEYVDVLDMSTSAEQIPRSKHTMKATRGQVRLQSAALCTLGFMLQMASGMSWCSWSCGEVRFDAASYDVRVRQLSLRSRTMVRRRMLILGTLQSCRFCHPTRSSCSA